MLVSIAESEPCFDQQGEEDLVAVLKTLTDLIHSNGHLDFTGSKGISKTRPKDVGYQSRFLLF